MNQLEIKTNEIYVKIETKNTKLFYKLNKKINETIKQFNKNEEFKQKKVKNHESKQTILKNENLNQKNGISKNEKLEMKNELYNSKPTTKKKEVGDNCLENYNLQKAPKEEIILKQRKKRLPPIETDFGKAYYDKGYYRIRNKHSRYNGVALHKAIYETHHKCSVLWELGGVIHHIDNNGLNNDISNLQLMSNPEHSKLHNPNGATLPKAYTLDQAIAISRSQNKSGYFRVSISKKNNKQGFAYRYQYYDENGRQKTIQSKDINKLEQKVKAKGLIWQKL